MIGNEKEYNRAKNEQKRRLSKDTGVDSLDGKLPTMQRGIKKL